MIFYNKSFTFKYDLINQVNSLGIITPEKSKRQLQHFLNKDETNSAILSKIKEYSKKVQNHEKNTLKNCYLI